METCSYCRTIPNKGETACNTHEQAWQCAWLSGPSKAALQKQADTEILEAIHSQVERMGLEDREPMAPTEIKLANAILVLLNVLIAERKAA